MTTLLHASRLSSPWRRRGIALLVVLASLLIVTTATTGTAIRIANARSAERTATRLAILDETRLAVEQVLIDWLTHRSSSVVLPPDAEVPSLLLLQDHFQLKERRIGVAARAFDLEGMLPLELAQLPPFADTLDASTRDLLQQALSAGPITGLDCLARFCDPEHGRIYPTIINAASTSVGASINVRSRNVGARSNEQSRRVRPQEHRLNLATAPLPLIETVWSAAGLGGIDAVRSSRQSGRPPPSGSLVSLNNNHALRLVSSSGAWAFLIEASIGATSSRWWVIFERHSGKWEAKQRLVATH